MIRSISDHDVRCDSLRKPDNNKSTIHYDRLNTRKRSITSTKHIYTGPIQPHEQKRICTGGRTKGAPYLFQYVVVNIFKYSKKIVFFVYKNAKHHLASSRSKKLYVISSTHVTV